MKNKFKIIFFIITIMSVLCQTALTFYLLYSSATAGIMKDVIIVITLMYVLAFLTIVILSFPNKKISREALVGYKRSQKSIKRVLTLLMLVISLINILNSNGSGLDLVFAIILLVVNVIIIYIDKKIENISDFFARKRKHCERVESDKKWREYRVGDKRKKYEEKN